MKTKRLWVGGNKTIFKIVYINKKELSLIKMELTLFKFTLFGSNFLFFFIIKQFSGNSRHSSLFKVVHTYRT